MFRKLVSHLPYSPALITEIGFYAKRLKDEDATRRLTVLFVALAMIMQSVALFSPPESANASSEQDIIRGGVTDINDFLTRYDHNEDDIKDIYTTAGVSRSEIVTTHSGTVTSKNNTYMMTRYGQLSGSQYEVSMTYQRSVGGVGTRYFSPLSATGGANQSYKAWIGQSATLGWFAIIQANGSLATHGIPAPLNPGGTKTAGVTKIISAENLSQNTAAETTTSKPLDKISYTLKASNNHSTSLTADFSVRIADILEYATLIDGGGGSFDNASGILNWPSVELAPHESQERTFVVQLLDTIPSTSLGKSNPESYDCTLTTVFGNATNIAVGCPAAKTMEAALFQMPRTGIGVNLVFMGVIAIVVVFFAVRTRQLKKEIRIIRHNFNTGII